MKIENLFRFVKYTQKQNAKISVKFTKENFLKYFFFNFFMCFFTSAAEAVERRTLLNRKRLKHKRPFSIFVHSTQYAHISRGISYS